MFLISEDNFILEWVVESDHVGHSFLKFSHFNDWGVVRFELNPKVS